MIDWSVILFLAIALLIFHMKEFGEHINVQSYLSFPENVKVSNSTFSLLFRLLTGTFIFIPFYLTVNYGYYSGFVVAMAGAAVLYFFSKEIERVRENFSAFESHREFLKHRFTKRGVWPLYLILLIAASEGLILSGLLANSFMETIFGIAPIWTCSLLLFFCFVFAGIGGAGGVQKVGLWLQYLFFVGITVLPISTILIRGVDSIYRRFTILPAPHWQLHTLLLIWFLFLFFITGQLLVYLFLTRDLLLIKKTRLKTTFALTAICWSAVPLAISVTVIYFMSMTGETKLSKLLPEISGVLSFSLLYLMVISVLCCFALSIGIALHNVTSLIHIAFPDKSSVRIGYRASFLISLLVFIIIYFLKPEIELMFLVYINLFITLSFPFWLMLTSEIRWGWDFSLLIIAVSAVGTWLSIMENWIVGAAVCLGGAGILFAIIFVRKIRRI